MFFFKIQYLEILGLQQTIQTFVQEIRDEGYPTPSSTIEKFSISIESDNELRNKDVEQLLKYFDNCLEGQDTKLLLDVCNFNSAYIQQNNLIILFCFLCPFKRNGNGYEINAPMYLKVTLKNSD
jgi:hypothetical protein